MSVIDDVNSVEPLIPDWTTAGTDLGNETIRDGKIYAINHGSLLCINLLYKICLICKLKFVATKAKLHVNEIAEKQDISVLGKVFSIRFYYSSAGYWYIEFVVYWKNITKQ